MEAGKYGPRTADVEAFFAGLEKFSFRDWSEVAKRWERYQNQPWGTAMMATAARAEKAGLGWVEAAVQTDTIEKSINLTSHFLHEVDVEPEDFVVLDMNWGRATIVAAKALAWRDVMDPDLFKTLWSPFQGKVVIPGIAVRGGGCLTVLLALVLRALT